MAMRIEKLTEGEMILLPKEQKETMFQASVVLAIRQSFYGNSDPANHLLKILPRVTSNRGSKVVLITYFEKWGSLIFDAAQGILKITKKRNSVAWTNEYESEVKANPWGKPIGGPAKEAKTVYDADREFRIVVARLQKVNEDSTKTLLHAFLVSKVQELLFAYGRSEDWVREDKKGRTLFDQSTQRTTVSASKFAKGSG
jgi:hypothetical protein